MCGIIVVDSRVICTAGAVLLLSSDLSVELPFTLTHPKPPESPQTSRPSSAVPPTESGDNQVPVDTNLIQLDTEYVDNNHCILSILHSFYCHNLAELAATL